MTQNLRYAVIVGGETRGVLSQKKEAASFARVIIQQLAVPTPCYTRGRTERVKVVDQVDKGRIVASTEVRQLNLNCQECVDRYLGKKR